MDIFALNNKLQNFNEQTLASNILSELKKDKYEEEYKALMGEQWDDGINKNKVSLPKYKAITEEFAYEERNATGGQYPIGDKEAGQPYNLRWNGFLFEDTNVKHLFNSSLDIDIFVDSTAPTKDRLFTTHLKERWSENPYSIFGLTKENTEKYYKTIYNVIIKNINKLLK